MTPSLCPKDFSKMQPSMPQPAPALPNNPLDLRQMYYTIRERVWIIAFCLLLAALASATYLMRTPKIYAAKGVLQVEQEEAKVLNIQRVQQEDLQTLEFLKTVEQTLQSRTLLERVIDTNHLLEDPRLVLVTMQKPSKQQLAARLQKMVEVRLRKGTRLIDIKVEHTEPTLPALIANSLVREFLRQNQEYSSSASEDATLFLRKEAEGLKYKLEASENALQNYKEQMQSASLEERQNVVVDKLKELSMKVTEANSQRIMHETAFKQVEALGTNASALMVLPAIANDPAIVEIRGNIAKKESEVANLRQRYKAKHPKMIQAESELAEWKSNLRKAILNVPQTIRNGYESAKAAEQALEKALREQEAAALDLNKQAIRYNVLARDIESDRALYQSVLSRIKETSLTRDLKPDRVRVVQVAQVPEAPVRPE